MKRWRAACRGTIVARDVGDRESLLTITITPRAGVSCFTLVSSSVPPQITASAAAPTRCARGRPGSSRRYRRSRSPPSIRSIPTRRCCRRSGSSSPGPTTRGRPFAHSTRTYAPSVSPRPTPPRGTACSWLALQRWPSGTSRIGAALSANAPAFVSSVHDVDRTFRGVAHRCHRVPRERRAAEGLVERTVGTGSCLGSMLAGGVDRVRRPAAVAHCE